MNTHTSEYAEKCIPAGARTVSTPSVLAEYGFYFYMVYTLLGAAYGMFLNNLASAVLLLLVFVCLWEVGLQIIPVIRAVAFPLGCGIAYLFIQLVLHEETSIEIVRAFLFWMLTLVLVQSLALRTNFLHRFVLVMLFIGLAALPYISIHQTGVYQRAALNRAIGFGHLNAMAEWYGFCAIYFVTLAFTTRKNALRILSLAIAIGCLYTVTLTVSRGGLLGVAVATVVAGRNLLKKGFFPVLLVVCLGVIVVSLGVFEQSIQRYDKRGTEDTGRLAVWPLIIDSFLDSPLIGVGDSNTGATPAGKHFVKPHNGFLYLAQSSGVVPLALFIAYWLRSSRAAQTDAGKQPDAAFYFPLLAFTFITVNLNGLTFMTFFAIVSLAIPMTASVRRQALDLSGQFKRGVVTAGFERAK